MFESFYSVFRGSTELELTTCGRKILI